MDLKSKLTRKKIEATLTKAILDSSIGESIEKVVAEVINKTEWKNGSNKSIVERAIYEHTLRLVQSMVTETVNGHREQIKKIVQEKLTDSVIERLTVASWDIMMDKMKADIYK